MKYIEYTCLLILRCLGAGVTAFPPYTHPSLLSRFPLRHLFSENIWSPPYFSDASLKYCCYINHPLLLPLHFLKYIHESNWCFVFLWFYSSTCLPTNYFDRPLRYLNKFIMISLKWLKSSIKTTKNRSFQMYILTKRKVIIVSNKFIMISLKSLKSSLN